MSDHERCRVLAVSLRRHSDGRRRHRVLRSDSSSVRAVCGADSGRRAPHGQAPRHSTTGAGRRQHEPQEVAHDQDHSDERRGSGGPRHVRPSMRDGPARDPCSACRAAGVAAGAARGSDRSKASARATRRIDPSGSSPRPAHHGGCKTIRLTVAVRWADATGPGEPSSLGPTGPPPRGP